MDKLLAKDWTFDEFVQRYTFVDSDPVLKNPIDMKFEFEKYRNGDLTGMELSQYQRQLSEAKMGISDAQISYKLEILNMKIQTLYDWEKLSSIVPEEYKDSQIKACGFMEARNIDDFPIRDMLVKLNIKRRRWEIVIDGKKQKVSRNWDLVIEGARMSEDYSTFLKEISRY